MTRAQLLTIIFDALASTAALIIGIWVVPEYRDFALALVAILQGVAAALIAYFAMDRKFRALQAELRKLKR